jgi:hypothetical protein
VLRLPCSLKKGVLSLRRPLRRQEQRADRWQKRPLRDNQRSAVDDLIAEPTVRSPMIPRQETL